MFRLLLLGAVLILLAVVLFPYFEVALAWVLAFFILLMLGDLLLGPVLRGRS
jgi:hypothetical protein